VSLFWHTKAPKKKEKKRDSHFFVREQRNFFVFPACIQICGQLVRKGYPCILVKQSCLYIPRCVSNDVEKKGGFESTLLGFFRWLVGRSSRERESLPLLVVVYISCSGGGHARQLAPCLRRSLVNHFPPPSGRLFDFIFHFHFRWNFGPVLRD
jgi:hypothetical protein